MKGLVIPGIGLVVALAMGAGAAAMPWREGGPGIIPLLWASVLAVICLVLIRQQLKQRHHEAAHPPIESTPLAPPLIFFAMAVAYVLAMDWIGYYFATALFILIAIPFAGFRRWPVVVAIAGGWLAVGYLVFERLLFIGLPEGRLWGGWG